MCIQLTLYTGTSKSISSHPLLVALWLYSVNCMHWHNRVYHHIHYLSHYGCIVSTVCTGTTEYIITSISVALWLYSVNCMHWHTEYIYSHSATSNGCEIYSIVPVYSVNCMHWHNGEYIITSITCRTMAV